MVLSLLNQALLSASNFALNLILIRIWQPELFGSYAIIFAVGMIAWSIQNALIGVPLVTLRAQAQEINDERQLLASMWMANCALTTAAFILTWAGVALVLRDQYHILPMATSIFVAGTLLREYVRSFLFSEFCVLRVFVLDAVYIFAAAAGLTMVWASCGALELSQLLLVLGFVNIFASLTQILARLPLFSFQFGHATRTRYINIWKDHSRWTLLGAVCTEVTARAHLFIVGTWFGAAAVGILEAGAMIYRPLGLILRAWARVAQPMFASLAAVGDFAGSNLLVRFSAAGAAGVASLFMIAVWAGWPFLQSHIFRGAYSNIGTVVALWGFVSVIFVVSGVYSTQLQGLARFRELSLTSIAGSLATMGTLALAVAAGSYVWAVVAVGFGNIVELALVLVIISRLPQIGRAYSWARMEVS